LFSDRADAGRRLADRLEYLRGESLVVVGLPRGGVPVAFEVAAALDAPLDVILVRKLGVPFQPELGMGAIGEDGVRIINPEVVRLTGVPERELATVEQRERVELERRARRFRGDRPRLQLEGRVVIVVDDGIATGSTARAACQVARARGAARVVLAVPVAPSDWIQRMARSADDYVCLATPDPFFAIGEFYDDFSQTSDDEVLDCLRRATPSGPMATAVGVGDDPPVRDEDVSIDVGGVRLGGHLMLPENAIGVVVFAHGSGSSRHSPRNRYVAAVLNQARLGTLLFDLLSPSEEHDRANVFDIDLLAARLIDVTDWLRAQPEAAELRIGYFGASTGAAAALWAASDPGNDVAAVVSRGGRPDLAGPRLSAVRAPTLLIVGGADHVVLGLNREAEAQLQCEHRLVVVRGATHLFDEPGTLEGAAEAARDWFTDHLAPRHVHPAAEPSSLSRTT
jgi:putative phosphoribosyl transferase